MSPAIMPKQSRSIQQVAKLRGQMNHICTLSLMPVRADSSIWVELPCVTGKINVIVICLFSFIHYIYIFNKVMTIFYILI